MTLEPRPYLLENKIQHYAWGSRDEEAFIPRFLGMEAQPGRPYAELWIGAHSTASSDVVLDGSNVSLRELIAQDPEQVLGRAVAERFSGELPFLFKVLSAAEALSIQVHPNKEQAQRLHARDPEHYPDDNHKPEVAIALDSLTALVGFKSLSGLVQTLEAYPEIAEFTGQEVCRDLEKAGNPPPRTQGELVRRLCSTLIRHSISEPAELARAIDRLGRRLGRTRDRLREEEAVFLDLRTKYTGGDVGLFSLFLLNLVHLEKGQGMFLQAGVPHSYLRGNIVECMANSDNVVRLGLTPKFKDAETLLEILDYEPTTLPILKAPPRCEEVVYQTPAPEFEVSRWQLKPGREKTEATQNSLEILFITKGQVLVRWGAGSQEVRFEQGQAILIPALLDEFTVEAPGFAELFKVEIPHI